MAQIRVIPLQTDAGYWRRASVGMLCSSVAFFLTQFNERGRARLLWLRRMCLLGGGVGHGGEVGPKETTGTALGSVACCLPHGSKLDRRGEVHALLIQCGPLSPVGIGTVNHFGNSFQLIKILPDRDC